MESQNENVKNTTPMTIILIVFHGILTLGLFVSFCNQFRYDVNETTGIQFLSSIIFTGLFIFNFVSFFRRNKLARITLHIECGYALFISVLLVLEIVLPPFLNTLFSFYFFYVFLDFGRIGIYFWFWGIPLGIVWIIAITKGEFKSEKWDFKKKEL